MTYYGTARGYDAAAETVPGPSTRRFAEVARRRQASSCTSGASLERSDVAGRYFNTSVVLGPRRRGARVRIARRTCSTSRCPGRSPIASRTSSSPATRWSSRDSATFDLGLSVCFDLRFPELYRRLAGEGATVLAVPVGLRRGDRARALGGPGARAGHREPRVRRRRGAVQHASVTRRRPGATR